MTVDSAPPNPPSPPSSSLRPQKSDAGQDAPSPLHQLVDRVTGIDFRSAHREEPSASVLPAGLASWAGDAFRDPSGPGLSGGLGAPGSLDPNLLGSLLAPLLGPGGPFGQLDPGLLGPLLAPGGQLAPGAVDPGLNGPPPPVPDLPLAPAGNGGPAGTGSELGLRAKEYGRDGRAVNPSSKDNNWYMSCLGWTNQAFRSEGKAIPELQAPDAKTAFQRAEANGKVHYGDPPPGAIVFYPEMSQWGHVGIVNEDGTSYRGTVPPGENRTTIGDRPIPNRARVAWMLPE